MIKQYARITLSNLNMAYRKTGTRDPSGILSGPYKNRKTGTLAGPYENRKARTLVGPYECRKTETLANPS